MNKTIEKAKEYFYNIDFLRFIFIFFIVNVHLFAKSNLGVYKAVYSNLTSITRTGYMAVDYFFIIAGFFLLFAFKDLPVIDFIKKKICKFWPTMFFLFCIYMILGFANIIKLKFYENLLSLFFVDNLGLTLKNGDMWITWFISALLLVSVFYYSLYKFFRKEVANLITGITTFCSYVFLVQQTKGIWGDPFKIIDNIYNVGLLRAIAGIGLGIIVYNIYEHFKDQNYVQTAKSFLLTSFVELSLFCFIIYETGLHRLAFKNKFILIFAFAALLLMFALKRGFVSKFFNKKAFANFGQYVLAIYLTHPIVLLLYKKLVYLKNPELVKTFPIMLVCIIYISIFVFAFLTHYLVEKPGAKNLAKKLSVK